MADTNTLLFENFFSLPSYRDDSMVELKISSGFFKEGGEFAFVVGAENQYGTSVYSAPVVMSVMGSESEQLSGTYV